jgi:hypothetical protein
MALPTLSKTWIFKSNHYLPTGTDINTCWANILFDIKQSLTTVSGWTDSTGSAAVNANPWTVTSSSNGGGGVASLGDNWGSAANVALANPQFPWVVLRQPAINPLFEIAFGGYTGTTVLYNNYVYVSHKLGFAQTGLVTTDYPATRGDRWSLLGLGPIDGVGNYHDLTLHYMMSTDGECTRVFGAYANTVALTWMFEKPKNPVTGWTNPALAMAIAGYPSFTNLYTAANLTSRGPNNEAMTLYGSSEGYAAGALGQNLYMANQITGEWPLNPIGLVCNTPGCKGRVGELYDMWYASGRMSLGDSLPVTGERQFMVFPNVFVPWNRSILLTQ